MATSPFRSLRSTLAVVVITISTSALSLGCTDGTRGSSDVVTIRVDDYPRIEPPRFDAELDRIMREFAEQRAYLPRRELFPRCLTTLPIIAGLPVACEGPARSVVAPGRAACERQTVPARSRRKLRTWERDAAA